MSIEKKKRKKSDIELGALSTAAAFLMWGILPVYWKQLKTVDSFEVLAHRIVWTCLSAMIVLTITKRWQEIFAALRKPKTIILFLAAACLLGTNWFTFIWAVNTGHIVECSLGYYINPLVNAILGLLILKERFRIIQLLAILLACVGVFYLTYNFGQFPWIAMILACSFSFYGLIRKTVSYDALPGVLLETGTLSIPALIYLFKLGAAPWGNPARDSVPIMLLLCGTGIITILPLLSFTFGARRIKYTTVGLIQYLTPTGMFLIGIFVYNETFTCTHMIALGCIWTALLIYSVDSIILTEKDSKSC